MPEGFNIDSLAVGPAESKGISRLTMVAGETMKLFNNDYNFKLFNVLGVVILPISQLLEGIMLLKVSSKEDTRGNILDIVQIFRAKVVDVSDIALTLKWLDPGKLL